MSEKHRRLGRGLEALIGTPIQPTPIANPVVAEPQSVPSGPLREIELHLIRANPFQPRKEFKEDDLVQLQASIAQTGLLQPITVRESGDHFQLVAGERRFRAVSRLGWKTVPAIIKDFDDKALLTLALVENLQRADLNPIEEAEGYSRLVNEFSLTQHEIATAVGKDRSTVANALRLLNLPTSVRSMLQGGQLTVGHARALLGVEREHVMVDLAREIVAKNLSVREVERRVKQSGESTRQPNADSTGSHNSPREAEIRRVTDRLRRRLQTDVAIQIDEKDRGHLRITFYNADDLNRVIELITGQTTEDL